MGNIIKGLASKNPIDIDSNKDFNVEALRESIIAEYDAINLYMQFANKIDDNDIKQLLLSIAQEEKVHVGELEAKLNEKDPEHKKSVADGIKEEQKFTKSLNIMIKRLENSGEKELKDKILGSIHHFLNKYEEDKDKKDSFEDKGNKISKSVDIDNFIRGYERLAYLGTNYSSKDLDSLVDMAKDINIIKQFKLPLSNSNRLEKVISVDSVAHLLHQNKNKDGSSQYKILDELANISKAFGEEDRNSRLLIIQNPESVSSIEKMIKLEILQKGGLENSGKFWRLMEKAIREGIEKLSNYEIIALREWVYAKI